MGEDPRNKYVVVYKCLGDLTRLRILNLLNQKPLCVSHLQGILEVPQTKMTKQLQYLKRHELIESARNGTWTIYYIPESPNDVLRFNLERLEELIFRDPVFVRDLERLDATDTSAAALPEG
tara:strand:+ start:17123 stop:17485 length:363 start_codon:yes stop_codon:yes gene_type:complete